MVKSSSGIKSFLVLVMVMMVSVVTVVPSLPILSPQSEITEDDSSMRIERSAANISHITGTARKIRMLIRNKYLQIFADGNVSATDDGNNDFSIIQRSSVTAGQVKIQGVATCAFLCMDSCGFLYSTREFDDECVFYETTESNSYNSYSSVKYSNEKHIYYIGITKSGKPRKVRIEADATLGKASEYTRVLPQFVDPEIVERLTNKILTLHPNSRPQRHNLRHHHICPPPYHMKITESQKCKEHKRKRNKKKRKCHEGDRENEDCHAVVKHTNSDDTKKSAGNKRSKSDDTDVESQPKKGKKRKSGVNKKSKQSKTPRKDSAERNAEGDADDTMTTIIPDDGADDEFLDKE